MAEAKLTESAQRHPYELTRPCKLVRERRSPHSCTCRVVICCIGGIVVSDPRWTGRRRPTPSATRTHGQTLPRLKAGTVQVRGDHTTCITLACRRALQARSCGGMLRSGSSHCLAVHPAEPGAASMRCASPPHRLSCLRARAVGSRGSCSTLAREGGRERECKA